MSKHICHQDQLEGGSAQARAWARWMRNPRCAGGELDAGPEATEPRGIMMAPAEASAVLACAERDVAPTRPAAGLPPPLGDWDLPELPSDASDPQRSRRAAIGRLSGVALVASAATILTLLMGQRLSRSGAATGEAMEGSSFEARFAALAAAAAEKAGAREPASRLRLVPGGSAATATATAGDAASDERAEAVEEAGARSDARPATGHRLDRDDIALLIRRSDTFIAAGDLVTARLLLLRAAEAGDAGAALTLGAIYDPGMLSLLRVRGVLADRATAKFWYARAKDMGLAEAQRRLDMLVQQDR
jgi:hypothetical protein